MLRFHELKHSGAESVKKIYVTLRSKLTYQDKFK